MAYKSVNGNRYKSIGANKRKGIDFRSIPLYRPIFTPSVSQVQDTTYQNFLLDCEIKQKELMEKLEILAQDVGLESLVEFENRRNALYKEELEQKLRKEISAEMKPEIVEEIIYIRDTYNESLIDRLYNWYCRITGRDEEYI